MSSSENKTYTEDEAMNEGAFDDAAAEEQKEDEEDTDGSR